MNTTFPLKIAEEVYQIGGRPLCSDDRLSEIYPELGKSLKENVLEDDGSIEDIEKMNNYILAIVKHFNPDKDLSKFICDIYSFRECIKIWNGQAELNGKKRQPR